MNNYKEAIYRSYITFHNKSLYGEATLERIRSSFSLWDHYYKWTLPENKSVSMLDIGCGNGAFVHYLNEKGYQDVKGIDVSSEQIQEGLNLGIKNIEQADIWDYLPSYKHQFEMVIARDVLEHFKPQEVFDICRLIYASLKPGGTFLFQSPNGEGILYQKIFYGDFTHSSIFTADSAHELLKSVGFNSIQCKSVLFPVHNVSSFVRMIGWKMLEGIHKVKRRIVYGSGKGIFTPNLLVLAHKF